MAKRGRPRKYATREEALEVQRTKERQRYAEDAAYREKKRAEANRWRMENKGRARLSGKTWHDGAYSDARIKAKALIYRAAARAKRRGIPCNLREHEQEIADVLSAGACQATGLPMTTNSRDVGPWTASLDRIDPSLGYIWPDNVQVVCYMHNVCKNRFAPEDVLKYALALLDFARKAGVTPGA